ncbi:MAG TPA: hypothetical protein VKP61_07595 [Candidatus Acidoferrum sp.]|nr:hypothetical protein [Candidatus Acidoferrum sp.]
MNNKVNLCLSLFIAALLGAVVGLHAQSNSREKLARLSEEKADISKMDLILLNTRVAVLLQILKDDLSLPVLPTSISYNADKQKIRTSVYVDPEFLARANAVQLSKSFDSRATGLCIAPTLAEGNFLRAALPEPPKEYCVISFFTHTLDAAGHLQTKEVAIFEDGKLTMK